MAKGLYAQISCKLPDKPEIVEVGVLAELTYYRIILRSREHLSDGALDSRVISRWLCGIREPKRQLRELERVGLLEPTDSGWRIPPDVWAEWNPTSEQVERGRHAKLERQRKWREKRARRQSGDAEETRLHAVYETPRDAKPEPEPKPSTQQRLEDGFHDWWNHYPRQLDEAKTRHVWTRLTPTDRTAATQGLAVWNRYWTDDQTEARYIPAPARWLTEKRWTQRPPKPRAKPADQDGWYDPNTGAYISGHVRARS